MARCSMLLLTLLLVAPAAAGAQSKGGGTAPSGFDSFILLVPPRDTISIKKQIRTTAAAIQSAEKARQQAETMRLGATSRIEFKKVEIVRIKDRINVAKKENRFSEHFDVFLGEGFVRRGEGIYRSTCWPAAF